MFPTESWRRTYRSEARLLWKSPLSLMGRPHTLGGQRNATMRSPLKTRRPEVYLAVKPYVYVLLATLVDFWETRQDAELGKRWIICHVILMTTDRNKRLQQENWFLISSTLKASYSSTAQTASVSTKTVWLSKTCAPPLFHFAVLLSSLGDRPGKLWTDYIPSQRKPYKQLY